MITETDEAQRIAELLKPGLYKACVLCDKSLEVVVRKEEHEHRGSCESGDWTSMDDHGRIVEKEILVLGITDDYDETLRAEFDRRVRKYAALEPRLQHRAAKQFRREREALAAQMSCTGWSEKNIALAADAIAADRYVKRSPRSVEDVAQFYDSIRAKLTFRALNDEARLLPHGLYELDPHGIKAHLACVEDRITLKPVAYRALAFYGKYEKELPALEFLRVLERRPARPAYAASVKPYEMLLQNGNVTLTLTKP